jgi:hypothetical protein
MRAFAKFPVFPNLRNTKAVVTPEGESLTLKSCKRVRENFTEVIYEGVGQNRRLVAAWLTLFKFYRLERAPGHAPLATWRCP